MCLSRIEVEVEGPGRSVMSIGSCPRSTSSDVSVRGHLLSLIGVSFGELVRCLFSTLFCLYVITGFPGLTLAKRDLSCSGSFGAGKWLLGVIHLGNCLDAYVLRSIRLEAHVARRS